MTAPSPSRCRGAWTICATTFFGVVAGDRVFLSLVLTTFYNLQIFFRHSFACRKGSHFLASFISSYFHRLIFRHVSNHFIIVSLAPGHFGWLLVWVATPLIHFITPRQESPRDIHLLSLDYFFCFRISFMFKWRLQFFHFLQEFLPRSSLLEDLLIILEHGSIS